MTSRLSTETIRVAAERGIGASPADATAAVSTEAARFLRERGIEPPAGAIVLGSGWGPLANRIDVSGRWPYRDVPGLLDCTTKGHAGEIVAGRWSGVPCVLFVGRWHGYEGRTPHEAALPAILAHALGARWILSTNAAGGMDPRLSIGDLVSVTADLVTWSPRSAFLGASGSCAEVNGPPYDPDLLDAFTRAAVSAGVPLTRGVLAMMPGPNYETAAEIAMLRRAGAHVVSMSTVPEARMAHMLGMRVAALSCVTNRVPSVYYAPLDHDHVLAALSETLSGAGRLIETWLELI